MNKDPETSHRIPRTKQHQHQHQHQTPTKQSQKKKGAKIITNSHKNAYKANKNKQQTQFKGVMKLDLLAHFDDNIRVAAYYIPDSKIDPSLHMNSEQTHHVLHWEIFEGIEQNGENNK